MYDCRRRCRRFVFEGNELLKLYVSYTIIEDNASIGDFYSYLSERVEKFCEDEYFPRLCEEFKRDIAEESRRVPVRERAWRLKSNGKPFFTPPA